MGRSGKRPDKKLYLEYFPTLDVLLFLELPLSGPSLVAFPDLLPQSVNTVVFSIASACIRLFTAIVTQAYCVGVCTTKTSAMVESSLVRQTLQFWGNCAIIYKLMEKGVPTGD